MGSIQDLRPLFVASLKMLYRSADTVLFWVVSPLLVFGIYALVQELNFGIDDRASSVDFFSFVAIGNAAFIGAHFAQDGIVGAASGYRASGILKRIAVTPISPSVFIAAQILARLVVALAATAVMLGLAEALGADVAYTANLVWIAPLVAIAVLTGVSFGFAIAGAMGAPESANQLNIALFTPVFMLAGIMYPLDGLPEAARDAAIYLIPFAAIVEAIRGVVDGLPITDFLRQGAIALVWLGIAFGLATRKYRFVEREA
ncbi:MAG: ABC transporter permease [Solirubrobacterales bacterium]